MQTTNDFPIHIGCRQLFLMSLTQAKIHNSCDILLLGLKCTQIDSLYHSESFILRLSFIEETQGLL